jgi:hypothetical protein
MTKQLMFYESAVPVSATRHADLSVETGAGYAFASHASAVPIMALEFIAAASEYAIVFTAIGDEVFPAVVLGLRTDQNLFLGADGKWNAKYVPAFIRRYPFVFSASDDGRTLTLCIDESHPGVNREGRGSALFGADAKPTPYVDKVLEFVKEFQLQLERTRLFGRRLKELGLLEPMQANVTTPGGEKLTLGGFLVASRDKLRALSGDALQQLARTDELELLYLHLYSLRNFGDVKDRLIGSLPHEAEAQAAARAAVTS